MVEKVNRDLAASIGIHDAAAVIKQIIADADVVQIVSCLYKDGIGYIGKIFDRLDKWMRVEVLDSYRIKKTK